LCFNMENDASHEHQELVVSVCCSPGTLTQLQFFVNGWQLQHYYKHNRLRFGKDKDFKSYTSILKFIYNIFSFRHAGYFLSIHSF